MPKPHSVDLPMVVFGLVVFLIFDFWGGRDVTDEKIYDKMTAPYK